MHDCLLILQLFIIFEQENLKDNHFSFKSSCPFESNFQTYYGIKINKIRNKRLHVIFIDSSETDINNSFGFKWSCSSNILGRVSPYLKGEKDKIKEDEFLSKEKDIIY